jgi:large subunit ribosomal protein L24
MEKKFSKSWISSKQTRKQRKYRVNAPLHIKQKFLGVHLSKELRTKYGIRSLQLRKGDTVKICRGQYKGKIGKVEEIFLKKTKVFVEGIDVVKKEGSKSRVPLNPSNLMITSLVLEDKKRKLKVERNIQKTQKKEDKK